MAESHQLLESNIFVHHVFSLSPGVRFILHGRIKSPKLKFKTVDL
jgi:hypothetical protein